MPDPQPLDYARPYFRAGYAMRSGQVVGTTIVLGAMCLACGCVAAWSAYAGLGRSAWAFGGAFLVGFLFTGAGLAKLVYGMLADRRPMFVIGPDGIIVEGTLTPWAGIVVFSAHGAPGDRAVTMFFQTAHFAPPRRLVARPRISPARYEELISVLHAEVGPLYPKLKLGGYHGESS